MEACLCCSYPLTIGIRKEELLEVLETFFGLSSILALHCLLLKKQAAIENKPSGQTCYEPVGGISTCLIVTSRML